MTYNNSITNKGINHYDQNRQINQQNQRSRKL